MVACRHKGFSFSEPYIKLLADKRPHKREKFKLNDLREKPPALAGFILGVCHKIVGRIPTDLSVGGSPLPPSIGCARGNFIFK